MEKTGVLSKTAYDFSKKVDVIQTIVIALLSFLVPTFLGKLLSVIFGAQSFVATNSQLIVGSIVNCALVVSAINLKGWKKILFVVTMPSISTIASGYIFGPLSMPMIYMIPAIWAGNFALIFAFKFLMLNKKQNYFLAGVVGIVAKVAIIFGFFSILNAFGVFPSKAVATLQKSMSLIQLITATVGTILAFGIYKAEGVNQKEIKE